MRFDELLECSGDSIICSIDFNGQILQVVLELGETSEQVTMRIPTSGVAGSLPCDESAILRTCRLQIVDLASALSQRHGYYVPAEEFSTFMKETRSGFHLAYGLKSDNALTLVSAVGYRVIFACVVDDVSSISVTL